MVSAVPAAMERHPRSNMRILSAAIAPMARKVSAVVVPALVQPSSEMRRSKTSISITVALQLLLWCSVLASTIAVYIITQHLTDTTIVPTCVLMCVAVSAAVASVGYAIMLIFTRQPLVSIVYIILHCAVSKRIARQTPFEEEEGHHISLSQSTIRLSVAVTILWLLTAGWNTIMVVRQVTCPYDPSQEMLWRSQATCIAHRIGALVTLLALYGTRLQCQVLG